MQCNAKAGCGAHQRRLGMSRARRVPIRARFQNRVRRTPQNGDIQGSAVSLAPQLDGSLGMSPFKHSEQLSTHLVGADARRVLHEELEACAGSVQ